MEGAFHCAFGRGLETVMGEDGEDGKGGFDGGDGHVMATFSVFLSVDGN